MDINDVMIELKGLREEVAAARKELREDIRELRRELADFRSSYEHHKAAESGQHSDLRDELREVHTEVTTIRATVSGGIKAISRDLAKVDTRVGILEG